MKWFFVVKLFKIKWFFLFCFYNGWFFVIWYGDDNVIVDGWFFKSELVFEWLLGKLFFIVELLRILWLFVYCFYIGNDCFVVVGCFFVSDVVVGGLLGKWFLVIEMFIDKLVIVWFCMFCFYDNGFFVIWFWVCFFVDGWFFFGEFWYFFVKVLVVVFVISVFFVYLEIVGIKGSWLLSLFCWLIREEFEFCDEIVVLLKRFVFLVVRLLFIFIGICDFWMFKLFLLDKFCRCWFMKLLIFLKLLLFLFGRSIIINMIKEKCV